MLVEYLEKLFLFCLWNTLIKKFFHQKVKGWGSRNLSSLLALFLRFLAWTGKEEIQREGGNSGDLVGEEDFSRAWKKRHLGWLGQFPHLEFSNNTINLTIKTIKFESEKKKFESEKK